MIVIILRLSFRDTTTEAEREEALTALRRTATMESTVFGVVGGDIGDPAEGFTHAYSAAITDFGALERYMYDPVHLTGDKVILPRLARLSGVRFSDDPDPAVAERVTGMYLEKRARHPEWARLLDAIPDTRLG